MAHAALNKEQSVLPQQLGQMASGYWMSQALRSAALLGIADRLAEKDHSVEELAGQAGVQSEALYRILRALASAGIFKENAGRRFSLTPLAELLCANHPQSQKSFVLMITGAPYQAWGQLDYAVKTGNSSFQKAFGKGMFEYLTEHPQEGKIFDEAMTGIHGAETAPMLDAYDFSGFKTVADIGGGAGLTIAGIVNRYPSVNGILFDLPPVVERAKAALPKTIRVEGGSFFEAVPRADAYVLRHIVHDWSDQDAAAILRTCAKSLNKGGKVLIVESVIPDGNDPCFGKWLDLMMLVIGGKERTAAQYTELLASAGLKLNRIVPTAAEISIVEAVAA